MDCEVALPDFVRACPQDRVDQPPIPWSVTKPPWPAALQGHAALRTALETEEREHGGIRREFVFGYADGDEIELFLATMAWGFGAVTVHWPAQRQLLASGVRDPDTRRRIRSIVQLGRQSAADGWSTMFQRDGRIAGLGPAFGTKLLYFAGYHSTTPQPLILDMYVKRALNCDLLNLHPKITYRRVNYLRYLNLAACWSRDPHWNGTPEAVEYALFTHGQTHNCTGHRTPPDA
jgi:hypothetical protein